mmetsp:Transcript_23154/g.29085  ORF Transcript_23154/g.29085 Transcript_23154/m.29085 type:complete len:257 (+) Transcript_23154:778-1548(+)
MLHNRNLGIFSLPQIQNHIRNTFYKSRRIDDVDKCYDFVYYWNISFKWYAQDWRFLPVSYVLAELFLHLVYLVLTVNVVWSKNNHFDLNVPTQIFLFMMSCGYTVEEMSQLLAKRAQYFSKDIWNTLDVVFLFCYYAWATTSQVDLLALNLFIIPFRIMHYLSLFKGTGSFVTVLMRMICDAALFLVSFSVILLGYALMCSSILQNIDGFGTFKLSLLTLFSASLGDFPWTHSRMRMRHTSGSAFLQWCCSSSWQW